MRTEKAARTRARILDAALTLFNERGYAATTVRDIAERAECATGLIYRYFPRREAFVLALYQRTAEDFVSSLRALPPGPLGQRFARAMHDKLVAMEPHKDAYVGLVGAALDRRSGAAVVGAESEDTRRLVEEAFRALIEGATDVPDEVDHADLARVLFVAHLAVVLAWTQDGSDGSALTHGFVDQLEPMLAVATPMLDTFAPAITALAGTVGAFYERGEGGSPE